MTGRCVACGRRGPIEGHHLSGRPAAGCGYLDPELVVSLCRGCHVSEHVGLRRLGLEFPAPGNDDSVTAHRLRRVGAYVGARASNGRALFLAPASGAALADLLRQVADILSSERVAP